MLSPLRTDDEVDINEVDQELCWRIFHGTSTVQTCQSMIDRRIFTGHSTIIDDNGKEISDEFIETRFQPYYLPACKKFNKYITIFGYANVKIVRERKRLYPIVLDYGTYRNKKIMHKDGRTQLVCYYKDGEFGWTKPDPSVYVWVEKEPTAAGRLDSIIASLIRSIIFMTDLEMGASIAEAGRCKPMMVTEARDSGLQSDNVRDTDFFTPGDASAAEHNRRAREAAAGAHSMRVTAALVEKYNNFAVGQASDPVTGIPTLDSMIKPQYVRHTFQLPPDQRLVAQQLPQIRTDLVDLRQDTRNLCYDAMGVPETVIHPAPGARTVASEEQTSTTFDTTVLYWKKLDKLFLERVYESIYGKTDDMWYTNLARQYRVSQAKPDESEDKEMAKGDKDSVLTDSSTHWKSSKIKRPRVHAVLLGVIDAPTLHGWFQRGLLTPQKYRKLLAEYYGIPEDMMSIPPVCDMKFDREMQRDTADLSVYVAEENVKAQKAQISMQKTEMKAAAAAGPGSSGGGSSSTTKKRKTTASGSSAGEKEESKSKASDSDRAKQRREKSGKEEVSEESSSAKKKQKQKS